MPAISVVIPVYNAEKYLRRCLDSLQNQTFTDWHAICINDGSRDASLEILRDYAADDARIEIIDKKNAGVSAARNDGLRAARGEFVHFMDADDFIDVDFYEEMYNASRGADMVCAGFVSDNKFARPIVYCAPRYLDSMWSKVLRTHVLTDSYVWRYLFRRDFLKKNKLKFDTTLVSQEDALFVLDAIQRAGRIVIAPRVSYHYMFNDMSALNSRDAAHRQKIKAQYKIGKQYRRDFAFRNNVGILWCMRKIIRFFRRRKLCPQYR